jgi:hypothetical protein
MFLISSAPILPENSGLNRCSLAGQMLGHLCELLGPEAFELI